MKNDEYLDYLFNKEVAIILKKKREEKDISLEELSNKIHNKVKRQTLFVYETGRTRIKLSIFIDICLALHLNPQDVLDEINMNYIRNAKI